ncbi:MAG: adenine deaminase [Cellulosilyticum sp.]|nr:adenine deaminase [Cellulosilyticum sp.]
MNKRYHLSEITQHLISVAIGMTKADLVIQNGTLINVCTGELLPHTDVAITHGRIALVGNASHTIGKQTTVIDATHLYIAPGFIDGHLHVESSMITVKEYAKAVLPHGTTTIVMDPHEIANILGTKGVDLMIQEGKDLPLNVYATMPSCVPATADFETTGATLSVNDIAHGLENPRIIGLGEMMNYPGVLNGDANVHDILKATLMQNKVITGHYPPIDNGGAGLNAYIASGACCCHETTRMEDALAKMRLGMNVQMREGSAWCDLKELAKAITHHPIDSRFASLVSDDLHPDTLMTHGHMDYIIRRAIEEGIPPVTAFQMATLNAAQCFKLDQDLGSVTPGKYADIVLLSHLENVQVVQTIVNGTCIAEEGKLCYTLPNTTYPEFAKQTMAISKTFIPDDFKIEVPSHYSSPTTKIHIISIIEKIATTHKLIEELPVVGGELKSNLEKDLLKLAVIDRHSGNATMGKGFVQGFKLKSGAVASTVAHDAHNLSVLGTNDEDMALAANTLASCGGGQVVVQNGKILALNPLPIAGLMSEDPIEEVAKRVSEIDQAWKILGCPIASPFMTMALLSLAVIPELRLTNKGLIDTITFKPINLFI